MAIFALTNAKVLVNTVNVSDHVVSSQLNFNVDLNDSSAMGATYHARLAGLKDVSLDLEMNQDFASGNVDATAFAALGTSIAVTWKAVNDGGSPSATNPEYQFNALIASYQVVGQKVGDKATATVRLMGNGAVTRAVA